MPDEKTPVCIYRELGGKPVRERMADQYFDATAMCAAAGKRFPDWRRLDTTSAILKVLTAKTGIPVLELIQSLKGGNAPGTWVHPKVAISVAMWCSPEFSVQVIEWIYDEKVNPKPRMGEDQVIDLFLRALESKRGQDAMLTLFETKRFETAGLALLKHPSIRSLQGGIGKRVFNKRMNAAEAALGVPLGEIKAGVSELRQDGMQTLCEYLSEHDRTGKDPRNKHFGREFHAKMRKFRDRHPSLEGEWKGTGPKTLYSRRMFGLFFNDHPDNRMLQMRLLGKSVVIPQPMPATPQPDMFPDRPRKH